MRILVLDNYDSFTWNLVHILRELGCAPDVRRNDQLSLEDAAAFGRILLSPGPGIPSEAGLMPALIRRYAPEKPMLGVCLGHQGIGEAFGAELYNLADVYHGVGTPVRVTRPADPLFAGMPAQFMAGRYHSWAIRRGSVPDALEVLAEDEAGEIMAIRHRAYPVYGVQFHPESIITEHGKTLILNWLNL
ncbi:MAG: aminodeoxychorismate/anthranilate synthase component II [Bacteroidia bacterium]|nr:aminodeoxychorismate/anthranilate synthase component II [Bacteroidia bacterium]